MFAPMPRNRLGSASTPATITRTATSVVALGRRVPYGRRVTPVTSGDCAHADVPCGATRGARGAVAGGVSCVLPVVGSQRDGGCGWRGGRVRRLRQDSRPSPPHTP